MEILKNGSKGEEVKKIQNFLKITVDGIFGKKTEEAVKKWQSENGLVVDGIVGPKTWTKMFGSNFNSKVVDNSVIYDPLNIHISKSPNRPIKYIVIHYTAGSSSKEGSAKNVKKVFEKRQASADFCVDDVDIVQFNPDLKNYYCWAVGGTKNMFSLGGSLFGKATNKNTISIEICSNLEKGTSSKYPNHKGWSFTEKSLENTLKLVKILMKKFNIPIERVIRHYDVTGKMCPGIIGWNNEYLYTTSGKMEDERNNSDKWLEFKKMLEDNE